MTWLADKLWWGEGKQPVGMFVVYLAIVSVLLLLITRYFFGAGLTDLVIALPLLLAVIKGVQIWR